MNQIKTGKDGWEDILKSMGCKVSDFERCGVCDRDGDHVREMMKEDK